MDDVDLTHLPLDVYDTKDGPWNPEHGELVVPDDWEFLPPGDAFVTRQVKAASSLNVTHSKAHLTTSSTGTSSAAPTTPSTTSLLPTDAPEGTRDRSGAGIRARSRKRP